MIVRFLLQVFTPMTADVTFSDGSVLACPRASLFVDAFNGKYGANAYNSSYSFPWNFTLDASLGTTTYPCPYLTSTFQFGCAGCPIGTYSLASGYSNGTSGVACNPACLPCPFGSVCDGSGAISAQPGYWGNASAGGVVELTVCPAGYCCTDNTSCTTIRACYGNRTGPLCGDCAPGFSESLDSSACVPTAQCDSDMRLFWPLAILGVFVDAFLQLVLVSDLLPHARRSFRACVVWISGVVRQSIARCQRTSVVVESEGEGLRGSSNRSQTDPYAPGDAKFKVFAYFTQVRLSCMCV